MKKNNTLHMLCTKPSAWHTSLNRLHASLHDGDAIVLMADAAQTLLTDTKALDTHAKNQLLALQNSRADVTLYISKTDVAGFDTKLVEGAASQSAPRFKLVDDPAWLQLCLNHGRSITYY